MPNIYNNVPFGTRSTDPAASDVPDGSVEYYDFDWGVPVQTEIVYGRTRYVCGADSETSCGCEDVIVTPTQTCECTCDRCSCDGEQTTEPVDDSCTNNTPVQNDDCGYEIIMEG